MMMPPTLKVYFPQRNVQQTQRHVVSGKNATRLFPPVSTPKQLVCRFCKQTFATVSLRKQHENSYHSYQRRKKKSRTERTTRARTNRSQAESKKPTISSRVHSEPTTSKKIFYAITGSPTVPKPMVKTGRSSSHKSSRKQSSRRLSGAENQSLFESRMKSAGRYGSSRGH